MGRYIYSITSIDVDISASVIFICVASVDNIYNIHSVAEETVQFSLVVVQPISFGDTPRTQVYLYISIHIYNIYIYISTQMVKMNEASHRIRCGVSGLPFPSVTWRAKGQNIRQDPGRKCLVRQKIL